MNGSTVAANEEEKKHTQYTYIYIHTERQNPIQRHNAPGYRMETFQCIRDGRYVGEG